jgi:hypothetical protein
VLLPNGDALGVVGNLYLAQESIRFTAKPPSHCSPWKCLHNLASSRGLLLNQIRTPGRTRSLDCHNAKPTNAQYRGKPWEHTRTTGRPSDLVYG